MKYCIFAVLAATWVLAPLPTVSAQTLTGQIDGSVMDSGGASVPGANIQLTNELSRQVRTFSSGSNGSFSFPDLITGTYSIHISKQGFRGYESKGIVLASGESYDLHEIRLEVGDLSQSISVEASAARIQTDSSDRFTTVEQAAVQDTPNPQRYFLGATRSMPGSAAVSSTAANGNGAGNLDGTAQLGSGGAAIVLQLDGIVQQDSGSPSFGIVTSGRYLFNNDAVSQVQVQVNIMNAEFGSRAGGQVTVTTKNGTSQFHGSLYTYLRNEDFNANSFFNNKTGVAIPKTRFQNPGGTFSGPVILPWLPFNRSRNKMYFFYAEDELYNKTQSTNNFTMPTDLEKAGDFSQTTTTTKTLIPIGDPMNGGAQFPGNIIPPSRISPEGAAFMNLFPTGCAWNSTVARGTLGAPNLGGVALPCILDPTGNRGYNTQVYPITNTPQATRTLRVDYNIFSNTTMYVRLNQTLSNTIGIGAGQTLSGTAWGQFVNTNPQNGRGDAISVIHTFSPTLIMDFTAGANFLHQQNQPDNPDAFAKASQLSTFVYPSSVGAPLAGTPVNPTQVFGGNYLNLIPNVSLGSNTPQTSGQGYVSSTPAFGFDARWPFDGTELTTNYTTNWTNIRGKHTLKAGFNLEHGARNVSVYENYGINGTYYFGTDSGNPLDSKYPLSNMLLGDVQSYGQDNQKQVNHARYYQYEWYLQDTWKVSRRFSLDYGMRFQVIPQIYSAGATLGLFNGNDYNAAKSGTVLMPTCSGPLPASGTCATANLRAINPKTGALYPGVDIGKFDPLSFAPGTSPYSGIDISTNGKLFNTQHPQIGPRIGFASDVFGDGKTSVRGGFGIFYNRAYSVDTIAASSGLNGPIKVYPNFQSPTFFNQTFSSLSSAQPFLGPQTFIGGSPDMKNPTVYSWSFGVQRDLGKGYVLEVAYVGNVEHHGLGTNYNANGIAPGTVWSPNGGTCSATVPADCTGTVNPAYVNPAQTSAILNINLLRTLVGYNGIADITSFTSNSGSNYNSMQEQLNKRFGKSLKFSSNWTWQKTLTIVPNQYLPNDLLKSASGRKQVVNIQLNYAVPSLTRFVGRNLVTKAVFDGWNIDAVLSYFSGNPDGVSCSVSSGTPTGAFNGQNGVGGAIPYRCSVAGAPFLPAGSLPSVANNNAANTDPSLWYPISATGFKLPALSTYGFGNAPQVVFWGPGYENEDVSIYKAFNLKKESEQFILRADIINVRNHFNPGDPNTSYALNYTTGANTNASFGQITSQTGVPRYISLSLRFRF